MVAEFVPVIGTDGDTVGVIFLTVALWGLGMLVFWWVVRSAVLSALREHEQIANPRQPALKPDDLVTFLGTPLDARDPIEGEIGRVIDLELEDENTPAAAWRVIVEWERAGVTAVLSEAVRLVGQTRVSRPKGDS